MSAFTVVFGSPIARLVLTALALAVTPQRSDAQIAVIVHPDSPVSELSVDELRRIFLGHTSSFSDGRRIRLIQNRDMDDDFFEALLDWSVIRLKQHWIGVVLSGDKGIPPTEVDASEALTRVATERQAIAFVDADAAGGGVKVLTIDGLPPGAAGYPLR